MSSRNHAQCCKLCQAPPAAVMTNKYHQMLSGLSPLLTQLQPCLSRRALGDMPDLLHCRSYILKDRCRRVHFSKLCLRWCMHHGSDCSLCPRARKEPAWSFGIVCEPSAPRCGRGSATWAAAGGLPLTGAPPRLAGATSSRARGA